MKQCCQNKNKIQVKKMIINFKDNYQEKEKLYKIVQYTNIIKFRKNNLLILLIISLLNYSSFLCKFKSKFSEVTIKIKETGNFKILSDIFFLSYIHIEISINDDSQNTIKNEYYFDSTESINIVKINGIMI